MEALRFNVNKSKVRNREKTKLFIDFMKLKRTKSGKTDVSV